MNAGLFSEANFQREFDELRKYYKDARLIQLRKTDKLLAVFQVGATHRDIKVLRWQLTPDGLANYLDNRGERDHFYPSSHSFVWTRTVREDQRRGRFPHISVRDKVFVEKLGGDLTIKVEDNTETGRGIYTEPVEDKAARQDGLRRLRDKLELFEDGADIIKFGRHRFLVNTQSFEMTVVPRDGGLALHLTGTDYYEAVDDPVVMESRAFWDQTLVSETSEIYRAEFLAASIFLDAELGVPKAPTMAELIAAERGEGKTLVELVRGVGNERYSEGYERGLHDADATKILGALIDMMQTAGRSSGRTWPSR